MGLLCFGDRSIAAKVVGMLLGLFSVSLFHYWC